MLATHRVHAVPSTKITQGLPQLKPGACASAAPRILAVAATAAAAGALSNADALPASAGGVAMVLGAVTGAVALVLGGAVWTVRAVARRHR